MNYLGRSPSNCSIKSNKNFITKKYKPSAYNAFMNELFVYLFAKEKKISFIPKLISFDLGERSLTIKNVGESLYDYCNKNDCDYTSFFSKNKKII